MGWTTAFLHAHFSPLAAGTGVTTPERVGGQVRAFPFSPKTLNHVARSCPEVATRRHKGEKDALHHADLLHPFSVRGAGLLADTTLTEPDSQEEKHIAQKSQEKIADV